ncbi:MAG: inositol monophosphatase [Eubacterium sp.]|nr:inositol monophosphatase [Eubacterium sp.]
MPYSMRKQIEQVSVQAGEMMREHQASRIQEKEGHANWVTDMDEQIQRFLAQKLAVILPEAALIGEEKENQALGDGWTWIVDPIDGTTNYIHHYRCSAVSIALLKDRKPMIGVIVDPYAGEIYSAERGKGAFLNDTPMHVSAVPVSSALVAFGTAPYNPEYSQMSLALAGRFLAASADIRRSGSAALDLAHLACGRVDYFFEMLLKPWDFAAGALLVEEAGGIFAMPALEEVDYGAMTTVLASNPECYSFAHAELLRIIHSYGMQEKRT